jgi:RNA-directed DNA polymerase
MLANLAMVKCDCTLEAMATEHGMTYSRYSDDMTFTTDSTDFTR